MFRRIRRARPSTAGSPALPRRPPWSAAGGAVPGHREPQVLDASDMRRGHLGEGHVAVGGRLGEGALLVCAQGVGRQPAGRQAGRGVGVAFDLAAGGVAVEPVQSGRRRQGVRYQGRVDIHAGQIDLAAAGRAFDFVPGGQGGIGPGALVPAVAQDGTVRAGSGDAEAATASSSSAAERTPASWRPSSAIPVSVRWMWESTKPGARSAPCRSITSMEAVRDGSGGLLGTDPGDGVAVDQHRSRKGIGRRVDGAVAVQRDFAGGGGGRRIGHGAGTPCNWWPAERRRVRKSGKPQ